MYRIQTAIADSWVIKGDFEMLVLKSEFEELFPQHMHFSTKTRMSKANSRQTDYYFLDWEAQARKFLGQEDPTRKLPKAGNDLKNELIRPLCLELEECVKEKGKLKKGVEPDLVRIFKS